MHEVSMPYYWGWHVSILVALGSILSYAFPGDRVEWYCIFQALVYAPFAFAIPLLVPARARRGLLTALFVAACSVAFAFGGQVVAAIGYPHFESFASAGLAILLAALAMGRERVAWVGLFMAIATREDCGFHAASFLIAVIAADILGRPFPIPRRRILLMTGVGLASTVLMMVIQKRFFASIDAFHIYITGNPPYAHLTKLALRERISGFGTLCGFIWAPMLATALIAGIRRDARYLLGWVVSIPWLVLNLTAFQDVKAAVALYTGFPFVGAVMWVGAYGIVEASHRTQSKLSWPWPVAMTACVSLVGLWGLYFSYPAATVHIARSSFVSAVANPTGLRAFAKGLRERAYGPVKVDPAMASWAVESTRHEDFLVPGDRAPNAIGAVGYAFFNEPRSIALLAQLPFPKCGRVSGTRASFCTTADATLPNTLTPSSPILEFMHEAPGIAQRDGEEFVVQPTMIPTIAVWGPYLPFHPGSFEVTWDLETKNCPESESNVHVDINVKSETGAKELAQIDTAPRTEKPRLRFSVTTDDQASLFEFRSWSGKCGYTLRGINVTQIGPSTTNSR